MGSPLAIHGEQPVAVRSTAAVAGSVAFTAVAVATGIWLAATARYRSDDYELVAQAWAGGSPLDGLRLWWQQHFTAGVPPDAWPKFHRPVWRALLLLDAHVLGCSPGASAALSWGVHCGVALAIGRVARAVTGSAAWGWLAAWLCLLPSAASEAPLWIAARGSVLATLATIGAINHARASALRARDLALVAVLVLAASTSHETGLAAAPLAALAAWLNPTAPRRARLPAVLAPIAVAVLVLAWRAAMLGTWIGTYPKAATPAPADLLGAVVAGTGAMVALGHGALPAATARGLGAAALVLLLVLVALARPRRRSRDALLLGGAAMVLFLLPFADMAFRGSQLTNGRALYAPHAAWSLALVVGLHALAGVRPHLAGAVAIGWAAGMVIAFAGTAVAFGRALRVADAVFTAVSEQPWPANAVLLGIPDHEGPFAIACNGIAHAVRPPFRTTPGPIAFASDGELAAGRLQTLAAAVPLVPDVAAFHWDARTLRFEPGWPAGAVRWRGEVRRDADGALRCGGLPLAHVPAELAPLLVPGAWLELDGAADRSWPVPVLAVRAVRACAPRLVPRGAGRWGFQGEPGDALLLFGGTEVCCLPCGAAGTLGVARAVVAPVRELGSAEPFEFELPAALAHVRLLQPVVFGPRGAWLGEVHVVR
jgi:hypothetical protein